MFLVGFLCSEFDSLLVENARVTFKIVSKTFQSTLLTAAAAGDEWWWWNLETEKRDDVSISFKSVSAIQRIREIKMSVGWGEFKLFFRPLLCQILSDDGYLVGNIQYDVDNMITFHLIRSINSRWSSCTENNFPNWSQKAHHSRFPVHFQQ